MLANCGSQAAEIRFRQQAECEGPVVRLADVADIITADEAERGALQAVELFAATGKRQVLRSRDVQDRLTAAGIKTHLHQFRGAAAIQVLPCGEGDSISRAPVSKTAMNLARTAAADAIAAYLRDSVDAAEDWAVEIALTSDQARAIASNRRNLDVSGGQAPWTGPQRFTLRLPEAAGGSVLVIAADVKRAPRLVVATNAIARGQRIRAEDLEYARGKAGTPQRGAFVSIEEVAGKEAARSISAGQVVDEHSLRAALLVKRGDVVDLFARAGGVQIRTKARARDEGSHGDLVNIELLSDRRALLARVCGIQEVEVLAVSASIDP
jgi:flagella basal body P-ring formation protein FlgA